MNTIQVRAKSGEYEVVVASGILRDIGDKIAELLTGRHVLIVSDENVAAIYGEMVRASLEKAGFRAAIHTIPPGEISKSQEQLFSLYDTLQKEKISRSDGIVALGGGVTGDLAGFAAATWLRGCPVIQIPTSLLAQVDSSVGGKTGIDLPGGKNLVGAFYQPRRVFIDTDTLDTLPPNRRAEGMAEIIKYGCIFDKKLFADLENGEYSLPEVIARCVGLKRDVVEKDELDTGERMLLNFGHTLGHAVEKLRGFQDISHGEAVSVGMVYACRIGEVMRITPEGIAERLIAVLRKNNLPVDTDLQPEILFDAMLSDKKNLGGTLYYVLLEEIGKARVYPLTPDRLKAFLLAAAERNRQ